MKRSNKVTLVLITAALASCNRYLIPTDPASNIPRDAPLTDSCTIEQMGNDPNYYTWPGTFVQQWFYAFNPFAGNYFGYTPYFNTYVSAAKWHQLSRAVRRGVVRGGWGRSAHSVHS